jgi:hypothetical protein
MWILALDLAVEIGSDPASQELKHVITVEMMDCVPEQGWIDRTQRSSVLENNVSRVLALANGPVIGL